MHPDFHGKVIAVIGGTSGMGLAIARGICASGGKVAALGRDDPTGRWRHDVVMICDGGPTFFGVEYDIPARRFTQFAFNGGF